MNSLILIALFALIGGLVQGISGFGAGIFMMMVLPVFYTVQEGAGIATCIAMMLTIMMITQYHAHVRWKAAILCTILSVTVSSIALTFSLYVNQSIMKIAFGTFLTLLSIYHFVSKRKKEVAGDAAETTISKPKGILLISLSAICDGLFGLGGPIAAIVFLKICRDKLQFIGTMQCYFFLTMLWLTCFRIHNGILQLSFWPMVIAGVIGVFTGGLIAKVIVDRMSNEKITTATYIMIGFSGIVNVVQSSIMLLI